MRAKDHAVAARRERSKIAGVGRVMTWNGGSLWIGRSAGHSVMHAHHAIQLSLALACLFEMKSGCTGAWSRDAAALVRPDARHEFNGCGTTIAQVFVEPETSHGRALLAMHPEGDVVPLDLGSRCAALHRRAGTSVRSAGGEQRRAYLLSAGLCCDAGWPGAA